MKSIKDLDFSGKKVLLRVDFNVPIDNEFHITDDTRIQESLPTIEKLVNDGAMVIMMSHLGRPKGEVDPKYSLAPVAEYLSKLLNRKVIFTQELLGDNVKKMVSELKPGDLFLLENMRFYPGETKGDKALAQELAQLGDVYINDAFGAAQAATDSELTKGLDTGFDMTANIAS
jgi:phosphoglycerate kinase